MKAADDRLSKGIGTGEFMCVYWPSCGQEAIAAAMGVALRPEDQLVTTYRGLHDLIGNGVPLEEIYGEMMGRTVGASRGKGGTMHIAKREAVVMLSTGIVGAGEHVEAGTPIYVIATEKAEQEIEARASGTVSWTGQVGTTYVIGAEIGVITS
ncbi:thiamine pyrophosphate-dependent enzyme [Mycobacterium sp. E2479]|uniref:thiamine pyrophosphate-dependent enzyme n=1 Tax=Mycobacterium sp. E2479 TaxID=1834134 RepID=UPI0035119DB1